jgi:tetratricopeptide (TPR) repeat protein
MRIVLIALAGLFVGSPALAQPIAACGPDAGGAIDFQACADAAPRGSPERGLSLVNLGTQALLRQDYATAAKLYDEAVPPGQQLFSDIRLHAYRGEAYARVGRDAEALGDAKIVLRLLSGERLPGFPAQQPPYDRVEVLGRVLPILKKANDPGYPAALSQFKASPAADWYDYANRAATLTTVGDIEGALAANAQALSAAPNEPAVLNNGCYLFAKAGRPAEGLPHCEKAVATAPQVAAVRESYATALEALGRCGEAQKQLDEARRLDPVSVAYQRKLACPAG